MLMNKRRWLVMSEDFEKLVKGIFPHFIGNLEDCELKFRIDSVRGFLLAELSYQNEDLTVRRFRL